VTPPIQGLPASTSTHDQTIDVQINVGVSIRKNSSNDMETAENDEHKGFIKKRKTLLELAVE
jgi:hypothetical protein